jgi:hypothetical protein
MHIEGPTACWLRSVEWRVRTAGWDELCALVHDHFGRDQHESLIRQLFHIHQSGTVTKYV